MAHFARLDENNRVTEVIVVNNDVIIENGIESEEKGINFCKNLYGNDTVWKQTSYNKHFRKHFAGIGFTYDENLDAFIPQKVYNSWILDTENCNWIPPIPMPTNDTFYMWSENLQNWVAKPDSGFWVWNYELDVCEEI